MAEEDSNQKVPRDGETVIAPRVPVSEPCTIGEFEIVAKLGQGGMGAVYKAKQTSLNRFVAIKVLPAHFAHDPEFTARFKREAMAAAALSHQNIVQAYAAGESNGQHYFAMEFVDGETLLSRIKHKKRIDPIEAVAVCENVAEGLKFAWERAKIIHRDIKPDNIFISNFGDVKLGDLGLAKQTGDQSPTLTKADVSMGTPHYVSPEQVMADKKIDFRADIYSLGCTLFHAVTGKYPYDGDSAMAIMMKHVNEPPPDIRKVWPSCPAPLAQLLDKMLQKDRDKRHQSYEELIRDLKRVDQELQQLAAVAKKKAEEALKPGPSFGVILGAIGAVSAVAIGLFVWAPWKSKSQSGGQRPAVVSAPATPTTAATTLASSPLRPATLSASDVAFIKKVAALPAEEKVKSVVAKLKELNPSYDGNETHKIEKADVVELAFPTKFVSNISPVRALAALQKLDCQGGGIRGGILSDLSPLKGLPLVWLNLSGTRVTDLSAVAGMPLERLFCGGCPIADLSPLKGVPLVDLGLPGAKVSDLAPLKGMPLQNLYIEDIPELKDLSPLAGVPTLRRLKIVRTKVTNLEPLKGLPTLEALECDTETANLPANRNTLRQMAALKKINNLPVAEFWKMVDAGKTPGAMTATSDPFAKEVASLPAEQQVARVVAELKKLNPKYPGKASHRIEAGQVRQLYCEAVGVTNIAPITALTNLRELAVLGTLDWSSGSVNISPLSDLAPLRDMKLTYFECNHALITDLSPLQDMPLTVFNCGGTSVKDLSPLKGAPLVDVACHCTAIEDLSPIAVPSLKKINCSQTRVRDLTPLAKTALEEIKCDADTANQPANRAALRQLSSLKKINNLPADEFWKQMDAGKRPKPLSATEVAWQNAINLLPLIDVEMDKVSGKWVAGPSGLVASDITQLAQKMQPPYRPGEEYDYRVSFTPVGGELSVAIGLTAKGRSFALYMKAFPNDNIMGFEALNGKAVASNPTGVHIPKLRTGRQYTVIVQVRKDGLKAYLDGELKTQWKTDYTDLSPWAAVWKFKDDALLGFGCSKTTARFDEVKVIEVTGKGTFTRGNPPAAK